MKELMEIQSKLKAPKNQQGQGVKYKYRSNEAILQAVKPLLNGAVLIQSDEIVQIGERYYVKATTTLTSGTESVSANGYARESETSRTGLDLAQLTGSCSSYARKYSISGLLLIDDNKDPDALADQKTVVKMPSRASVNAKLLKMTIGEEYDLAHDKFGEKYGESIWGKPSGKQGDSKETWADCFKAHRDRIDGVPPVNAKETDEQRQFEFNRLCENCSDKATYDILANMHDNNPSLQNQTNVDKLLDLAHDFEG